MYIYILQEKSPKNAKTRPRCRAFAAPGADFCMQESKSPELGTIETVCGMSVRPAVGDLAVLPKQRSVLRVISHARCIPENRPLCSFAVPLFCRVQHGADEERKVGIAVDQHVDERAVQPDFL